MITKQENFLEFLGRENTRFYIPVYQRAYSWALYECEELWNDIMNAGKHDTSHFLSMTLYLQAGTDEGGVTVLDIVDGQQRTATMVVLLTAFREYLRRQGVTVMDAKHGAFDAAAIEHYFLVAGEGEAKGCKITLRGLDHTTLNALVMGTELPAKTSVRVVENYELFSSLMEREDFDPQTFWDGMQQLLIIDAELDEDDAPQVIFESLNTKGLPLTAADLMRNYLLVAETRSEQKRLYEEYWSPIEMLFTDDILCSASTKLNTGLRMWLAIRYKKTRALQKSRIYNYFKEYMTTEYEGTSEELLDELRGFSYVWAGNYECNEGRTHLSRQDWAKGKKDITLVTTSHSLTQKRGEQFRIGKVKTVDDEAPEA